MLKQKTSLFLKRDYQVIYAIVLIILIPITIIINTIWSVKSFQRNMDISLQRQTLSIGKMFNFSLYQSATNTQDLQNKLVAVVQANLGLQTFDILERDGENLK